MEDREMREHMGAAEDGAGGGRPQVRGACHDGGRRPGDEGTSGSGPAEGESERLEQMLAWAREVFGGELSVSREPPCPDEDDA